MFVAFMTNETSKSTVKKKQRQITKLQSVNITAFQDLEGKITYQTEIWITFKDWRTIEYQIVEDLQVFAKLIFRQSLFSEILVNSELVIGGGI